jgi:hypothetical protein
MTETEWLACEEPMPMVGCLQRQMPHGRKLRLFTIACCRRIWRLLADERNRQAVEVAERFANKQASEAEREAASAASYSVYANTSAPGSGFADAAHGISRSAWQAAQAATIAALVFNDNSDAGWNAACAVEQIGNAVVEEAKEAYPAGVIADYAVRAVAEREQNVQVRLIRCIFGNPFRPATLAPAWRTPTVFALAQTAYDERAFDRLPVLADALEDASCTDRTILEHLRGPGPHVRGCWVVDMLLGKS